MAPRISPTWFDRAASTIAPRWQLKRLRARIATDVLQRHYEAASDGRRTAGWRRPTGDANTVNGPSLARLRDLARDLVRNNPYAESARATIVDHTVGWGITAKPRQANQPALEAWQAWTESRDCDADGRHDFAGLQKLVMSTVVESGEAIVRRRRRRLEDGYAIPLQLQVLEPDHLDTSITRPTAGGGQIVQGVEFDALGDPVAYWLFPTHPGASVSGSSLFSPARRIPAADVLHVFKAKRPGQVRGVTWFADVLLRFKDFDEFEDATLMKQKVAALLAVVTSDVDGSAPGLGTPDDTASPMTDALEPGAIINAPPGRTIQVVQPPTVREYADYCATTLRGIAAGLGVTYEDLTGDYRGMPFSAARMSRLRHWARVDDWRWQLLIPQFCDPVWGWAMEAQAILQGGEVGPARWTAPPPPMIDPANEGLAIQRNVRTGIQTPSEAIRERGYDPDEFLAEYAADLAKLDALGIVLDSDARRTSQAGLTQVRPPNSAFPDPDAEGGTGEDTGDQP